MKRNAIDVLYEKMVFYDTKATSLGHQIVEIIKVSDKSRGDLLTQMFRTMVKFNDIVIDCANKLAPYQSAKMQSIEIRKETTHRFVVEAPKPAKNTKDWLNNIQAEIPQHIKDRSEYLQQEEDKAKRIEPQEFPRHLEHNLEILEEASAWPET